MNLVERVRLFLGERTRLAETPTDFVFLEVLQLEFVAWQRRHLGKYVSSEDRLAGKLFTGEPTAQQFAKAMKAIGWKANVLEREGRLDTYYDLVLLDREHVEQTVGEQRTNEPRSVIERIRAKQEIRFGDGVIAVGDIVDQISASDHEKKELDRCFESDKRAIRDQARQWILIRWNGRRRYCSSAWFSRLERNRDSG